MNLHEYAIIGHQRSEIGRWLGIASFVLAPLLTSLVVLLSDAAFLIDSIRGKLAVFTLTAGIVYLCLYWIFNRYVWKWLDKLLEIPNLSGEWIVVGETLDGTGATTYSWNAEMKISQFWDRIAIELKTLQSGSYSETASVLVKPDGECKLSYSYQNHPRVGEVALNKHQGFCELIFDVNQTKALGHYFNSLGRYTFGRMTLTRKAKETK